MNDPRRLYDEHQGDLESILLAAMRSDHPPTGARARVLAGISGWVPALVLGFWAKSVLGQLGPWTKIGLCLVAGAVPATVAVVQSLDAVPDRGSPVAGSRSPADGLARSPSTRIQRSRPAVASAKSTRAPITSSAEPVGGDPSLARSPRAPPEVAAVVRQSIPRPLGAAAAEERSVVSPSTPERASSGAFPLVTHSSLDAEAAALHRVRGSLDAGNAQAALEQLETYGRTFRRGSLSFEAAVLRVQALLLKGDRAGAEALGRSLLAASPDGPHARRLQTLLNWNE